MFYKSFNPIHTHKVAQKLTLQTAFQVSMDAALRAQKLAHGEKRRLYIFLMASNTKLNLKLALNSIIHFQ